MTNVPGATPSGRPAWMDERPCSACATGYGECVQGWTVSLMCCKQCSHEPYDPARHVLTTDHIAASRARREALS